ncbi:ATP-binding protein [Candidatus Micrarchaeota archaeon]|nr:ATP-binding protein [Candidatus Micrarchaeota archaeon]MBU1681243.1 ATP-binding protein [Candidatus Micrarchaeota archaeon]
MTKKIKILEKPTDSQRQEILMRISQLYNHPEYVVYEYIQNSIDSAFEIKDKEPSYDTRKILVHIDYSKKQFIIQDNCAGMDEEEIENLPNSVFQSRKKRSPWITGEFGYGIQSFRAWFDEILIVSKASDQSKATAIIFNQSVDAEIDEKKKLPDFGAVYPVRASSINYKRPTGTDVWIKGIRKKLRKKSFDFIAKNLFTLIPIHFEDALESGLVEIQIYDWKRRSGKFFPRVYQLNPLRLSDIPGEDISGTINDNSGKKLASYHFKIVEPIYFNKTPEIKDYKPRLSRLGTELGKLSRLKSLQDFGRSNDVDLLIWDRPELIGKINIERKIPIRIDRTDLEPSLESQVLFDKIAELTLQIQEKFDEMDKRKLEEHEESLSEIMSDVFTDLSKELDADLFGRKRKIRSSSGLITSMIETGAGFVLGNKDFHGDGSQKGDVSSQIDDSGKEGIESTISDEKTPSPSEEGTGQMPYKDIKQRGMGVEFKPLGTTQPPSNVWGDRMIVVNTEHPFYRERLTEHKSKIITKRLIAYLAIVTTPWFLDKYWNKRGVEPESTDKIQKIVETIARVEKILWDKRELIKKKVAEVEDV